MGRRAPVLNLELIDLHVTTGTVRTDRAKFSAFMWILLYLLNALKYMYLHDHVQLYLKVLNSVEACDFVRIQKYKFSLAT